MNHPDTLAEFAITGPILPKRVYLAGPMRGKTRDDMAKNFAEFRLARQCLRIRGLKVFCPAERDEVDNNFDPLVDPLETIDNYMADDLPEVCRADGLVVLPGWENSQGARTEAMVAMSLGKPVYRYDNGTRVTWEMSVTNLPLPAAAAPSACAAAKRKATPIYSGVLAYFPLALAEVARTSQAGNDQHHPGTPLHWDKTKSTDELDALTRHLTDHASGHPVDTDGKLHLSKVAWRALAALQRHMEQGGVK